MARRPLSLQARSTFAAFVALAAFLGLTGVALDKAYYDAAVAGVRDRLQSYVYAYLAGIEVSRGLKLIPPETPPNPDFARPGSGLYAVILGDGDGLHWESASALGRAVPLSARLAPNTEHFEGPVDTAVGRLFVMSLGVNWEVDTRRPLALTVHIAQSEAPFHRQIAAFRQSFAFILVGHVVFTMPFMVRTVASAFQRNDLIALEEAARTLGASFPQRFLGVLVPAVFPAIVAGALMVFTLSVGEFNLTWMLHTPLTRTLPVGLADSYASMRIEIGSAYTLVFFIVILPVLWALQALAQLMQKRYGT